MARLSQKGRLAATIAVVIVVAAILAVRLIMTPQRLVAIFLPRIEKIVDAKVSIGSIKVNFPFGFGVAIEALEFKKELPDTTSLDFYSKNVTVRASLLSILKRKPEINSASIHGGYISLVNVPKKRDISIRDLSLQFSMKPVGEGFESHTKARVDSVLVSISGSTPPIVLEKISFEGDFETDRAVSSLSINNGKVSWSNLVSLEISGTISDISGAPSVDLSIEAKKKPLSPIFSAIRSWNLDELARSRKAADKVNSKQPQVELSAGLFSLSAHLEGPVRDLERLIISFETELEDLALSSDNKMSIGLLGGNAKGSGSVSSWMGLFPGASEKSLPQAIASSWRKIELAGKVHLAKGKVVLAEKAGSPRFENAAGVQPFSGVQEINAIEANLEIMGADVSRVSGRFEIRTSPFTFEGSLGNIVPAMAEFSLIARKIAAQTESRRESDLGPYLDAMVNSPIIEFEIRGRSFDISPYAGIEALKNKSAKERQPVQQLAAASSLLLLKNTNFTLKLDSIIAREAVLTRVEAKGTIRDGRMRIDPLSFDYAGGAGTAKVSSDLRNPQRIETSVDFSIENVEADRALERLFSLGDLIKGSFTFKAESKFAIGAGLDALTNLKAFGSAHSKGGSVSFEKYLASLAAIQNLDLSSISKFEFRDWNGTFRLEDGRIRTDDWRIESRDGIWSIAGSFGLDGTLDYLVHVIVPPATQTRMKNIEAFNKAFDLMRDQSGNLVLDIKVKGNARQPSAMLDVSRARSKAQDKVMEGLKKLIR